MSDDSSAINDNNEIKNIDFSDNSLLSEVSIAAKNELSSVVVSEDALNKVLDDSVGAIKNVNQKIDTATNLTDKESAAFTVTSELKEQVKVAAKSELQNPGSSKN